ncbi:MAG: sulfite oxidase [Chloroflexi bacterium]|nr:sulfite oxidase [Chloroflexota bacterium]
MASHTSAAPYPGKSAELISLGDGLNYSSPLAKVSSGTLVRNPLFFLRSNNPPPDLEAEDWRLQLEGRVKRALTLDMASLRALSTVTHELWLECAGNSRSRFNPPGEGNQWDDQAISDARFTGVPLATLLDQAGVETDAVEVVFSGYDRDADGTPFQRGLPLEVARDPSVFLAYEMNGEPIPASNGGPVRLIVPRWAGIASVKWPARIEVVNQPFRGYFNAERYIMVDRSGQTVGLVREMPVKSIMAWPNEGDQVAPGEHAVFGFAWSGFAPIRSVEISSDDGQTWTPSRLVKGDGPLAWTRWEYTWRVSGPGEARLMVRATDAAGNVQPARATWNKFGYQMNAILTRTVTVG